MVARAWIRWSATPLLFLAAAAGSTDDGDAQRAHRLGEDVFVAGSQVRVSGALPGDAIAAGGEVLVDADVAGDTLATGRSLRLRGTVRDDLYAAGAEVRLAAHVAGNARIAGGEVEIEPTARVDGGASVAGGRVRVDGRIGKYLQVGAGSVRIDGEVGGDAEIAGGELRVGPGAVIDGTLIFRGPRAPIIDAAAQVRGGVKHIPDRRYDTGHRWYRLTAMLAVVVLVWLLGWFAVGAALLAVFPVFSREVTAAAAQRTGAALLTGLAFVFGAPVLMVLLALTLVGIPAALTVLLCFLLLLPVGYLAAGAAVGDRLLLRLRKGTAGTTMQRIGMLAAALAALLILTLVPILGSLLGLALLTGGVGSVLLALARRYGGGATAQRT